MGWCSGTEVAQELVDLCEKYVPRTNQAAFLKRGFTCLRNMDWDCPHDLFGGSRTIDKLAEQVLKKIDPEWYEDEDEYDPEDDRDDS